MLHTQRSGKNDDPRPSQDRARPRARASKEQKDSWMFIVSDEVIKADSNETDTQPRICKLRHPRLNTGNLYLACPGHPCILELNSFKEKFRSWFVGDTVRSDSQMYITTPVDPLFLILPYLINAGEGKLYMTIDQLICDEDFLDCHLLQSCCDQEQLTNIADWKELDDNLRVFRYSKYKTLAWLKMKTEAVANALEEKNVGVSAKGSHSTIFIRSKCSETSKDAYLEYAHGIVSDYLSPAIEEELKKYLGIPEVSKSTPAQDAAVTENEPPSKKLKQMMDDGPIEDYSAGMELKKDKSKTGKLTAAQKKLSKVDKTGMKSISSFFSPK